MSGYDGEDSGQQGFALIVVLWAIILLGTIAAAVTQTARTETRVARNVLDQAKAEALADGAVHRAILALRNPDAAERWPTDGSVRHFTLGEGESFITIEDEGGKVDLNGADEQLMAMLLRGLGLDAAGANALVDAIVDYRDEDDLRRLNGAEAGDYAGAGLAWRPRNGPFEDVGELKRVLGMEKSLFERLAPLVTVYTYQRGIDPEV
ncbi:MAG: general secretion pathway protein GspK, partial [Rhodospirillales bacterium]|nr:general secretion pathway protein GspK [Rhodospirillales bacterium]